LPSDDNQLIAGPNCTRGWSERGVVRTRISALRSERRRRRATLSDPVAFVSAQQNRQE
jgi:hypothetical protein